MDDNCSQLGRHQDQEVDRGMTMKKSNKRIVWNRQHTLFHSESHFSKEILWVMINQKWCH